jgi:hypothetical protein
MTTFIPGWMTSITIDGDDWTVHANVLGLTRTKSSQPKPVFGTPFRHEIPGQASGTLDLEGHVAKEHIQDLEDAWAAATSLPYVIQVGTSSGATDSGTYAGKLVLTELTIDTDAEGEWEWSASATLDGAPIYTAPV